MQGLKDKPEWIDISSFPSEHLQLISENDETISLILLHLNREYPDPFTGRDFSVSFVLVMEDSTLTKRARRVFSLGKTEVVPIPWKNYYSGLKDSSSKKFLRYDLVRLIMLAFSSCLSIKDNNVNLRYRKKLVNFSFQRILNYGFFDEIRHIDDLLVDRIIGEISRRLWLD